MASVYIHKQRGYQVRYAIYLPDGNSVTRYRYRSTRVEADHACRECSFLESGSRAGNLSSREIAQARRDGYLDDALAVVLCCGTTVVEYDLPRVVSAYRNTISVTHTPVAYDKAIAKVLLLAEWLGSHPVPSLTEADIKQYLLDRREGRIVYRNAKTGYSKSGAAAKTLKNELSLLQGLIQEAVKLRMVTENVARSVSVPVKNKRVNRSLSKEDIDLLLAAAHRHNYLLHGQIYEFVMVALYTGFRRSELRTLTWEDIDLGSRRIVIQSKPIAGEPDFTPKSGEARSKSIPDRLMPVLESMCRRGRFLFGGDAPYNITCLSQVMRKVMGYAGLPAGVSLHNCRHTYGSWLLRKTGDLKYVQGEMGHLDVGTTKGYMHFIESDDPARSFDYD